MSDPVQIQHEDPYVEPERGSPLRRLLICGAIVFVLLIGSFVPLFIIGHRALRLDSETKHWKEGARRRALLVNAQEASIEAKRLQVAELRKELNFVQNELKVAAAIGTEKDPSTGDTTGQKLSKQLDLLQTNVSTITREMANLDKANKNLQKQNQELLDRIKANYSKMTVTDGDSEQMTKLKQNRQKLLAAIAANREIQKGLADEISSLSEKKAQAIRHLDVSKKEADKYLLKAKVAAEALVKVQNRATELKAEIAKLSASKEALGEEISRNQKKLDELKGEVAKRNKAVGDLDKKLASVRNQIARQERLLASNVSGKVSTTGLTPGEHKLQKELAELEIKVFQAQIKSLQAEKDLLMKDVRRLNQQIKINGGSRTYRTKEPDNG